MNAVRVQASGTLLVLPDPLARAATVRKLVWGIAKPVAFMTIEFVCSSTLPPNALAGLGMITSCPPANGAKFLAVLARLSIIAA